MQQNLYDVNFKELYVFIQAAECDSFTKAAARLAMTQSAVSKNIEKLEEKLDLQLFTRDHKNLYITEAGNEFLAAARKCIDRLSEDYNKIWELQHEQKSRLRVGLVNNTELELYFWPLWTRFKRRFPEVIADYNIKAVLDMAQLLFDNELDIAFFPDFQMKKLEQLNLPWKWVAKDYARIVVPKGHPLEKKAITFEALENEPIVVLKGPSSFNLEHIEAVFAQNGYKVKVGKQFETADDICRFYESNDGILLTDIYFDCSKFHEKIVKRTFKGMEAGIIVSWNPKFENEYVKNFVKMLEAE